MCYGALDGIVAIIIYIDLPCVAQFGIGSFIAPDKHVMHLVMPEERLLSLLSWGVALFSYLLVGVPIAVACVACYY